MEEFQKEEQAKASSSGSPFTGFQNRVKHAYERIKRFMGSSSSASGSGSGGGGDGNKGGKEKEKEKEKEGKDQGAKEASG
jgi:uncharacterized membrane protein